jgi:hypothetical protein
MQNILSDLDAQVSVGGLSKSDHIFTPSDIISAISRLNLHKNDGYCGLSTDHFRHAGPDLAVHIAFLFTCMVVHGSAPKEFGASTIIPIPKSTISIRLIVIIIAALRLALYFANCLIM